MVSYKFSFTVVGSAELTAVSLSMHVSKLYGDVRNQGISSYPMTYNNFLSTYLTEFFYSDNPHRSDPAILNAETRNQICEYIFRSEIFDRFDAHLVTLEEIVQHWSYPRYFTIFGILYGVRHPNQAFFEYMNPYRKLIIKMPESN